MKVLLSDIERAQVLLWKYRSLSRAYGALCEADEPDLATATLDKLNEARSKWHEANNALPEHRRITE